MRGMTLAVGLVALIAHAADGGAVADAGAATLKIVKALPPSDAGGVDAGAAPGKASSGWKARPVFVIAQDDVAIDKYALAKPSERAAGLVQLLAQFLRARALRGEFLRVAVLTASRRRQFVGRLLERTGEFLLRISLRARISSRSRGRVAAAAFRILGGGAHRVSRLLHAFRHTLTLEILRDVTGSRLRLRVRGALAGAGHTFRAVSALGLLLQ